MVIGLSGVCNHMSDQIRWPRNRSPICLSQVWLQTELDNKKSYYQSIIKITVSKKIRTSRTEAGLFDLNYNFECDWFNLNYNCLITSELVENRGSLNSQSQSRKLFSDHNDSNCVGICL